MLSTTDKTDNFCVVCYKCCQTKVESTRKSLPEDGVFFVFFGILPERTDLLTKIFFIDKVTRK